VALREADQRVVVFDRVDPTTEVMARRIFEFVSKALANGGTYADASGNAAQGAYPANPNGSPGGLAGVCSADGRVTLMMPHPERVFRTVQHSWHPPGWGEDGPWMRMFRNARAFSDRGA